MISFCLSAYVTVLYVQGYVEVLNFSTLVYRSAAPDIDVVQADFRELRVNEWRTENNPVASTGLVSETNTNQYNW